MNKFILLLIISMEFMVKANSFILEEKQLKLKILPSNESKLKFSGNVSLGEKIKSYQLIVFDTKFFVQTVSYTFAGNTSFKSTLTLGGFGKKFNVDSLHIVIYKILNNKAIYINTFKINLEKGEVQLEK